MIKKYALQHLEVHISFLSNRENLCATCPWVRARTPGQTAALTRGKCTTVYDMGLEPTNVQKMVFHTQGSGISARGMERYDPPIYILCGLF